MAMYGSEGFNINFPGQWCDYWGPVTETKDEEEECMDQDWLEI